MPAFLQRRVVWPGLITSLAALALAFPVRASDKNPVIVHEWGTFTSLQDENGQAIGGINVDDEPVPFFVWGDGGRQIIAQHEDGLGLPPYLEGKGLAANDSAVTERLETPVIYIYPPNGKSPAAVPSLTVHVDFHGGILSQFFPLAKFEGLPLVKGTTLHRGALTESTTTSLTWMGVHLGSNRVVATTDNPVWTTPRETSAPILETNTPEPDGSDPQQDNFTAEHFLFYRGVGHFDPPIHLQNSDGRGLINFSSRYAPAGIDRFAEGWMVEIRPDGSCAFRSVSHGAWAVAGDLGTNAFSPGISENFREGDFDVNNLAKLQASMREALMKEGLYADEASAMLRTWDVSYFKSPGLRFFYTVPREWTDHVLPLKITGAPTKITRVMIGRVELISDAQKAALARLAVGPCPDLQALKPAARAAIQTGSLSQQVQAAYLRGDLPLGSLGIPITPAARDYLDLGRFRDVLILREQKMHPSPALAQFIQQNHLEEASLPEDAMPSGTTASD